MRLVVTTVVLLGLLLATSLLATRLHSCNGWSRGGAAAMATAATQEGASGDSGLIVVYVTVPDMSVGEKLSEAMVEARLAACVNIVPGLTSVYFWEGKVNKDSELLLIIKTQSALLPRLIDFVKSNHPYTEPEVVALPILGGSPSYLKWVKDSSG